MKQFKILNDYNLIYIGKEYFNDSYWYHCILINNFTNEVELTLGIDWDYSKTTLKHLKMFLYEYQWYGQNRIDWSKPFKKQIEKLISEGVIIKTW